MWVKKRKFTSLASFHTGQMYPSWTAVGNRMSPCSIYFLVRVKVDRPEIAVVSSRKVKHMPNIVVLASIWRKACLKTTRILT